MRCGMAIGMRGHDLDCGDAASLGRRCREYGVDVLQLALAKSIKGIEWRPGVFSPGLARQIKMGLDAGGVHVSVLGCYINPVHPDEAVRAEQLALFREHLRFAKYIGADMIGTETGSFSGVQKTDRSEEVYQLFLEGMRPVVREAEKLGVMVGIEGVTEFTIYSPERMKRFLDDIDSPNVTVIFDPVNLLDHTNYKEQREVMRRSFELFGDCIGVVHLKDFVIEDGKKQFRLSGDGLLDHAYLFGLVKQYKPDIDMIIEEAHEEDIDRVRGRMREAFAAAQPVRI